MGISILKSVVIALNMQLLSPSMSPPFGHVFPLAVYAFTLVPVQTRYGCIEMMEVGLFARGQLWMSMPFF